ncbi:hypothetical protein K501DRAFT_276416 [Backusella circina FSU 941]|nr:hypothetical protein K501DRAFT_276416 [Backusella circina FSU 941]
MRKLKLIVSQWTSEQRDYYDTVLSTLIKHNYSTDDDILDVDINTLCTTTGINQQTMYAFVQQVINETLPAPSIVMNPIDKVYLSTGFEELDKILLGGLEMGKVHEICGTSTISRLTPHVMADMIANHVAAAQVKKEEIIHIFDTNGTYDTKHLQQLLTRQEIELDAALSFVNYTQVFTLSELARELENLCASLITATASNNNMTRVPLVVIQDVSKIIGACWTQQQVVDLISHIESLCKTGCFMLIEHKVSLTDMIEKPPKTKYEMHWNPSIDTRLYFSSTAHPHSTRVDILKSRHVMTPQSLSIQMD